MTTEIHTISKPPQSSEFTPLTEHQSSTPSTFFGGQPVLHYSLGLCDLLVSKRELAGRSWLSECFSSAHVTALNGDHEQAGEVECDSDAGVESFAVVEGVQGFVTSDSLVLYTSSQQPAISIPYPSLSLHATQRLMKSTSNSPRTYKSLAAEPNPSALQETQAVYLQLEPSNPSNRDPSLDEDDSETVELFLIPQEDATSEPETNGTDAAQRQTNGDQVHQLFEALSRCADLHPDSGIMGEDEDDEGSGRAGGLAAMMGMGGAGGIREGGWITAENAHEYEGQFGDEEEDREGDEMEGEEDLVDGVNETTSLGPGAGTRRPREGRTVDENGNVEIGEEDTKWQRTD